VRLEFDAQTPTPDEVTAILAALEKLRSPSGAASSPPIWKLAMLYPDASIDELRLMRPALRDVF